MIYDTLENWKQYAGVSPRLALGLKWLAETDLAALPDGKVELDGADVFASLSAYETKPGNDTPEAHRKYIDVQYLVSGQELVGVAPLADMVEEVSAHPDRDIWFYHGATENLTLSKNRFMVFFPQDAHAPCIAVGAPATARKCVVKVRV